MADHLKQKDKRHRGLGFDTDEPSVKKFATNNDPSKTSDATDHPADKPIHFVSQDGGKQLDL